MNRRHFSLAASSIGLLPLVGSVHAQGAGPKAGTDYLVLSKPVPVEAPAGKVEVVEFFSYNCPHCAAFEPSLESWVKRLPPHVVFKRVPVPFVGSGADIEAKQRLYYTLEAMGKLDEFHMRIFQAIHSERVRMFGDEAIAAWFAKQPSFDNAKFAELFKSFSVSSKAKRAGQTVEAYKVAGVPALGIAGRFYVDGTTAGSMDRALRVTEALIESARKG
ncbi:MAG: thiol:disulfide interchange protein DsbA/DsbL [Comamonadaceae bacterium]|nr:MAG: thiol:disulfide interchange protein DsbA/DsbL [Comamonadaceae bacterium]